MIDGYDYIAVRHSSMWFPKDGPAFHGPPPGIKVAEPLFYVQDARSYVGNSVMWWGPDGKGYTTHIDRAGKYTAAEAMAMRETDVPYPVEEVDEIWSHHVDMQDLRRRCPKITNIADDERREYMTR